jgi:hypothetical protein
MRITKRQRPRKAQGGATSAALGCVKIAIKHPLRYAKITIVQVLMHSLQPTTGPLQWRARPPALGSSKLLVVARAGKTKKAADVKTAKKRAPSKAGKADGRGAKSANDQSGGSGAAGEHGPGCLFCPPIAPSNAHLS